MNSKILEKVGYPARVGAMVVNPPRPTCVTATSSSKIDLFLASFAFGRTQIRNDVVLDAACIKTHRPHGMELPLKGEVFHLVWPTFETIPVEPKLGPRRDHYDWTRAERAADHAIDAACVADPALAIVSLDLAYQTFANSAEKELMYCMDHPLATQGRRGQNLKPRWVKSIPSPSGLIKAESWQKQVLIWNWLSARLRELLALSRKVVRRNLAETKEMLEDHILDSEQVEPPPHEKTMYFEAAWLEYKGLAYDAADFLEAGLQQHDWDQWEDQALDLQTRVSEHSDFAEQTAKASADQSWDD